MKRAAALAFALAASATAAAWAQPAPKPPEQAAGHALLQCVAHADGTGTIAPEHVEQLTRNGFVVASQTPAHLQHLANPQLGTPTFAQVPATEGEVWAIGYNHCGAAPCSLVALVPNTTVIEERLLAMLRVGETWKEVKSGDPARRTFEWRNRPKSMLIANVDVLQRPAPQVGGAVLVAVAAVAR